MRTHLQDLEAGKQLDQPISIDKCSEPGPELLYYMIK